MQWQINGGKRHGILNNIVTSALHNRVGKYRTGVVLNMDDEVDKELEKYLDGINEISPETMGMIDRWQKFVGACVSSETKNNERVNDGSTTAMHTERTEK